MRNKHAWVPARLCSRATDHREIMLTRKNLINEKQKAKREETAQDVRPPPPQRVASTFSERDLTDVDTPPPPPPQFLASVEAFAKTATGRTQLRAPSLDTALSLTDVDLGAVLLGDDSSDDGEDDGFEAPAPYDQLQKKKKPPAPAPKFSRAVCHFVPLETQERGACHVVSLQLIPDLSPRVTAYLERDDDAEVAPTPIKNLRLVIEATGDTDENDTGPVSGWVVAHLSRRIDACDGALSYITGAEGGCVGVSWRCAFVTRRGAAALLREQQLSSEAPKWHPEHVRAVFDEGMLAVSALFTDVPFVRPLGLEDARDAVGGGADHFQLATQSRCAGPTGLKEGLRIIVLDSSAAWAAGGHNKLVAERLSKLRPGDVLDATCDSQGNACVMPESHRRKSEKARRKASLKGTDALSFPLGKRDVGWAWITATHLRPLVASEECGPRLHNFPTHLHERSGAALLKACRAAAKGEPQRRGYGDRFDTIKQQAAQLDAGRRLRDGPHAALRDRVAHLRALLWLEEASTQLNLEAADVHEAKLRNIQALPALTANPYYAAAPIAFAAGVAMEAASCTLTVPGASESASGARPPIQQGDAVRLRPTEQSRQLFAALAGGIYELRAVVADVRADVLTLVLPRCPLIGRLLSMEASGDAEISWHARFRPNQAGVRFLHDALSHISADPAPFERLLLGADRRRLDLAAFLVTSGLTGAAEVVERLQAEAVESIDDLMLLNRDDIVACGVPAADAVRLEAALRKRVIDASDDDAVPEGALGLNEQQRGAVAAIAAPGSGGPPVVVFGPPGTGKTAVVAEAIRRLAARPGTKVLCCAPSDEAADVLTRRVAAALANDSAAKAPSLLRLNWWQRKQDSVDPAMLRFCFTCDGQFEIPSRNSIKNRKVCITTCAGAGMLLRIGLRGEFSHIIVDEAAQALEPEALVPVALAGPATRVTLAGDPNQLGPAVRSTDALKRGLGTSLLKRLLLTAAELDGAAPPPGLRRVAPTVCKLNTNYRAHGSLLALPSRLFYGDALVPANKTAHAQLLPWEGTSLLCWGVNGTHAHAVDSPSFINHDEAKCVASLLESLLRCDRVQCEPRDIGVLCAFRAQTLLIRQMLRAKNLGNVMVGQIYDFQGCEYKVVIVSLTLSRQPGNNTRDEDDDSAPPIGLLGARRFNVAVTRAKALCVVVGHPKLLASEPYWRDCFQDCVDRDAYRGAKIEDGDDADNGDVAADLTDMIASKNMLGGGDLDRLYPRGDRALRALHACETAWRIAL